MSAYPLDKSKENTFQAISGLRTYGNNFSDKQLFLPLPDLKSINSIISDFVGKINSAQVITPTFVTNQNAKYNFTGYTNPETGSDMVFSRENISNMNADEFLRYEKDIMNQLKTIGIPFDRDLQNPNSGTVFVKSYVRSNGTKVKSHYRSIK